MDKSRFSQEFHDMRLRVVNSRGWDYRRLGYREFEPCPVVFWAEGKPEAWLYGILYVSEENGILDATLGDLTITVSPRELMVLVDIATNSHSKYVGQW